MNQYSERLKILARYYRDQCGMGHTTHAHALEMFIVHGIVTYDELGISEERLKVYILLEARARIDKFRANGNRDAVGILGSFLTCDRLCAEMVTAGTTLLSPKELDSIKRQVALETARGYLEDGILGDDCRLELIRELASKHHLTSKELDLTDNVLKAILAPAST